MRGMLLLAVFAAIISAMILSPYAGLMGWAWFSFMHPHRETFGFTSTFSFDWYVALIAMLGWLLSRDQKFIPVGATPILIYLFTFWICVTTYFAIDPDFSYELWDRTIKSMALVLFVMMMTTNMVRMQALVWVIAISLGYFAVKGAGFVIFGSAGKVWGPEESMIRDNNHLGVALSCAVPLFLYLYRTSGNLWIRYGSLLVAISVILTVVGTFSRGGFVALMAMGLLLTVRSRAKLSVGLVGIIAIVLIPQIASEKWVERMNTIWDPNADESVQLRYSAWNTAWNVAVERPITGGGFSFGEQQQVWDRYSGLPAGTRFRAAHSIYFEVLGEHGFVGLALYLLMVASALRNTQVCIRMARDRPDRWIELDLAYALQVSIVGVLIGGVSLSLAYYDGFLTLYAMTFALRRILAFEPTTSTDQKVAQSYYRRFASGR